MAGQEKGVNVSEYKMPWAQKLFNWEIGLQIHDSGKGGQFEALRLEPTDAWRWSFIKNHLKGYSSDKLPESEEIGAYELGARLEVKMVILKQVYGGDFRRVYDGITAEHVVSEGFRGRKNTIIVQSGEFSSSLITGESNGEAIHGGPRFEIWERVAV